MNTPMILESVDVLKYMIHPEWFDGRPGQPGTPLRPAVADYLVSEIVRNVAANLKKAEVSVKLHNIGKDLATQASKGMVQAWDDGDDWCGNGRLWWLLHHLPIPGPGPDPGPDPVYRQQFMTPAMNDILLAHALREVALLTYHEQSRDAIREAGEVIVKNAATTIYDEYCKTQFRAPKPVARAA
jgi:hypothetical protein